MNNNSLLFKEYDDYLKDSHYGDEDEDESEDEHYDKVFSSYFLIQQRDTTFVDEHYATNIELGIEFLEDIKRSMTLESIDDSKIISQIDEIISKAKTLKEKQYVYSNEDFGILRSLFCAIFNKHPERNNTLINSFKNAYIYLVNSINPFLSQFVIFLSELYDKNQKARCDLEKNMILNTNKYRMNMMKK